MRIGIGMQIKEGPWGGGNRVAASLAEYCRMCGDDVVFDLNDSALDLVLLWDPIEGNTNAPFRHPEILAYLLKRNPRAIVVHRINDSDAPRGTSHINQQIMEGNLCADHTVFISRWLQQYFREHGLRPLESSVIYNGADRMIFNALNHKPWNPGEVCRIVTHHWGPNRNKGFDIYERLDHLLSEGRFGNRIEFTFVGNLAPGVRFRNANHIPPLNGRDLSESLQKHHLYLTAALHESAGMHHIEAAMCGLPILYRESGALPEYCDGFGISFTPEDFETKLEEILASLPSLQERIFRYPHDAETMCRNYRDLFLRLLSDRERIIAHRAGRASELEALSAAWQRRRLWRKVLKTGRRLLGGPLNSLRRLGRIHT